jgi:hypothetical protein
MPEPTGERFKRPFAMPLPETNNKLLTVIVHDYSRAHSLLEDQPLFRFLRPIHNSVNLRSVGSHVHVCNRGAPIQFYSSAQFLRPSHDSSIISVFPEIIRPNIKKSTTGT